MRKKTLPIIVILAVFLFLAVLFLLRGQKEMADFKVNSIAGKRIRMGETLYKQSDGHYQFKYPPSSALLYAPLSCLPPIAAKAAWFLIILASSILIFHFSLRLARKEGFREQSDVALFLPLLILAKFFLRELQLGQINALLTALLLFFSGLLVEKRRDLSSSREWMAGTIWGAAVSLKPYALIFLPYLALKKRTRILAAGLLFFLLAFSAPAFFYGIPGNVKVHREWISSLSRSTPSLLTSQDNISLVAFFMKWTGNRTASWTLYFAAVAAIAGLFLFLMAYGRRVERPEILECAFLLTMIPLVSPLGWDYTMLSSALAVTMIIVHFSDYPAAWKILIALNFLVIALALYDLMGRALYAGFMALSIPTLNALILSGCLARLRMKGHA